jgi:hypothetical protein
MLTVGAMAVIALVLLGVAMTPVAINLVAPPRRGVSNARVTIVMVAIAAVAVIGLGYGIAADRLAGRRRSLTVTGVVLMAVGGAVVGLVALFSAGF